jgi:hypothetical protein
MVSLLGCPQFRRIYFATRLNPGGGNFTYVPHKCVDTYAVHTIHQIRTLWASTKCACQVEHVTQDLGAMECEVGFISLSQEFDKLF